MNSRTRWLAGAMALVAGVAACRDAAVSPRAADATPPAPDFAAVRAGNQAYHVVSNGDYGSADWGTTDASGTILVSLYVSRSGASGERGTFLSYDITRCDPSELCTWEYGYGDIPNEDLTGSAAGGLHLVTNTAGNPEFFTNGAGGLVAMDWRREGGGQWMERSSGTLVRRGGGMQLRHTGTYTNYRASATGQVLGIAVGPSAYAGLGSSHRLEIEIVRDDGAGAFADIAAAAGPAPAVVLAPGDGQGEQDHLVADGEMASLEWSVEEAGGGGRIFGSLYVSRGLRRFSVAALPPLTELPPYLSYDIVRCDASDHCTSEYGNGLIPDGDFTGNGQTGLRVHTNTAGLPDFYNSGAGGEIAVEWRRNGLWVQTRSGSELSRTPWFTAHRQGRTTSRSATATGQILGVAIAPVSYSEIGTNRMLLVNICRGSESPDCVNATQGSR